MWWQKAKGIVKKKKKTVRLYFYYIIGNVAVLTKICEESLMNVSNFIALYFRFKFYGVSNTAYVTPFKNIGHPAAIVTRLTSSCLFFFFI